jgi:hypothetical protein
LKKLPVRGVLAAAAAVLGLLAAAAGVVSLPWVKPRPAAPPRVERVARGEGPLTAGAAVTTIDVPAGAPIGGFPHLSYGSEGVRDPVTARALVLSSSGCRVALVSAELLLVPASLDAAVRARLRDVPLDGLVLAATHTHASPGGYWENAAFERFGLGPFDPAVRDRIANAIALAVRQAAAAAGPARLSVARGRVDQLVRNRSGGDLLDGRLTALRLARPDGEPVAEVALLAAHPTVLGRHNRLISGDWPGQLLAGGEHGTRLFFQGAVGDQSTRLPDAAGPVTPEAYAEAVGRELERLAFGAPETAPALAYASANTQLPAPALGGAPALLRRAAANVGAALLPGEAQVSAVQLGPVLLLAVPGEPVAAVGARWREVTGPGAEILALADGYIGYMETAEQVDARKGETVRTYYGPALAPRIEEALGAVVSAIRDAPRKSSAAARPR